MTSACERHGITRWSISRLNKAQADIALLLLELKGVKGSVGPAAHRGTAAEAGIVAGLMDPQKPLAECQEIAVKEFDKLTVFNKSDSIDKERAAVPRIVEQGIAELRPYGVPTHTQYKVEWRHPDLSLPFLGYADLFYEEHGIILDIKSTLKMPSSSDENHERQVASYCLAISDNLDGRITYATPTKAATYRVENMKERIVSLVQIAQRVERFLSISDDIDELCGLVIPNYSLFYYDAQTRAAAKEIFGC